MMGLHRYGGDFAEHLDTLKLVTEQAKAVVEAAPNTQHAQNGFVPFFKRAIAAPDRLTPAGPPARGPRWGRNACRLPGRGTGIHLPLESAPCGRVRQVRDGDSQRHDHLGVHGRGRRRRLPGNRNGVVDDVICPERAHQLHVACAAYSHDLRPEMLCQLHRGGAHRPGALVPGQQRSQTGLEVVELRGA
jgi:hypothetical protein